MSELAARDFLRDAVSECAPKPPGLRIGGREVEHLGKFFRRASHDPVLLCAMLDLLQAPPR